MTTTNTSLPYERPIVDDVLQQSHQLADNIAGASHSTQVLELVNEWNSLRNNFITMQNLAEVRFTQNVADPSSVAEKEFFDRALPTVTEAQHKVIREIVQSPFRADIEREFGALFLRRLEDTLRVFSSDLKPLLIREAELQKRYNEITASAKIDLNGTTYNLSTLSKVIESTDRSVRIQATQKLYEFLDNNGSELDAIYDELVSVRVEKAKRLGYSSYAEFRNVEMGRVDYTESDIYQYREKVKEHVVPVASLLREAQKRRLGLNVLTICDEKIQFPDGNPVAVGEHDQILQAAQTMYRELSAETDEFFSTMLQNNLLDLKSRDSKATGGYCTSFPSYKLPFIFANFNKTTHDVEVLTHEAGHAFQAWRSRNHSVPEYLWPTMEACEIHSMSMEYLTWPWMHLFFGDDAERFKFYHLQSALLFLPYGCLVDHFQYWVYAHPDATAADRRSAWLNLEAEYLPWRTTDGIDLPEGGKGRAWQLQRHIYESPFYYIDYTLASLCALQYWTWSLEEAGAAFASYLSVCDLGGSKPFLDIVRTGGLHSPFAPETMPEITRKAYEWLRNHYATYL